MKVRILRPALEDLASGRKFYERQSRVAGEDFFAAIFAEIDWLEKHAGVHRLQLGFHRLLVRRFPFPVYYRVRGGEAVVFRVLDCRRDPNWIKQALKKGL